MDGRHIRWCYTDSRGEPSALAVSLVWCEWCQWVSQHLKCHFLALLYYVVKDCERLDRKACRHVKRCLHWFGLGSDTIKGFVWRANCVGLVSVQVVLHHVCTVLGYALELRIADSLKWFNWELYAIDAMHDLDMDMESTPVNTHWLRRVFHVVVDNDSNKIQLRIKVHKLLSNVKPNQTIIKYFNVCITTLRAMLKLSLIADHWPLPTQLSVSNGFRPGFLWAWVLFDFISSNVW